MTEPLSYVEKEFNDTPPIHKEEGSSFSWETPFSGWEDGKVFAYTEPEYKDYHEMIDTDGKASSLELMLSYPIISAPWSIEAAKDDAGEAEFIYDALTALPHQGGPRTTIEELVSQMTMAFTDRRAYFEKVFKINDDDKVVYDKLAWRPPETCELALDEKNGDLRGFRQRPIRYGSMQSGNRLGATDYVDIPMERAFIYVHGSWRDPLLGISSMRVPYWCYITKRKLRWLWYQFLDQTMLPKTIVKNPDEQTARADAKKVATLRSRGVLGISSETTVEAYESSGHGAAGYIEAIRFLDSEMSNSALMGFMDLTSQAAEGKGSYALSESQGKLFLRTRRMVARDMARQITNRVIGDLIRYNFGIKASCPRFEFGALSEQNEQAVLDMFSKVATTGAKVSPDFYDQLQLRTATLLELDPGKVKKDMDDMAETPGELQQIAQQVDVATKMVSSAQEQGKVPPSPVGPAPTGGNTSAGSRYGAESVATGKGRVR